MKRTSFGSGIGEGKVGAIGDNRYGLREEYDPKVREKTLEYYRSGHEITVTEVKDVNLQTVTTVKGPKVKFKEWLFQRFFKDHLGIIKKAKKL